MSRQYTTKVYTEDGTTLIEVLITISIISFIFVIASDFVINGLNVQSYVSEQNDAVVESRKALAVMVGELRETANSGSGAYPLDTLEEQEIIFYSNIDDDTYPERIRYSLNGTIVERGVIHPSGEPLEYDEQDEQVTTVSQYIQNGTEPLFYYYNEDYPEDITNNPLGSPADPTEVRLIQISLSTNVNPNSILKARNLDIMVHLRNLKENY